MPPEAKVARARVMRSSLGSPATPGNLHDRVWNYLDPGNRGIDRPCACHLLCSGDLVDQAPSRSDSARRVRRLDRGAGAVAGGSDVEHGGRRQQRRGSRERRFLRRAYRGHCVRKALGALRKLSCGRRACSAKRVADALCERATRRRDRCACCSTRSARRRWASPPNSV